MGPPPSCQVETLDGGWRVMVWSSEFGNASLVGHHPRKRSQAGNEGSSKQILPISQSVRQLAVSTCFVKIRTLAGNAGFCVEHSGCNALDRSSHQQELRLLVVVDCKCRKEAGLSSVTREKRLRFYRSPWGLYRAIRRGPSQSSTGSPVASALAVSLASSSVSHTTLMCCFTWPSGVSRNTRYSGIGSFMICATTCSACGPFGHKCPPPNIVLLGLIQFFGRRISRCSAGRAPYRAVYRYTQSPPQQPPPRPSGTDSGKGRQFDETGGLLQIDQLLRVLTLWP
jgi:hypothetical protein